MGDAFLLAIWTFVFGLNLAGAIMFEHSGRYVHWFLLAVSLFAVPYYAIRVLDAMEAL